MPGILPSVTESLSSGSVLKIVQGSGKSAPSGIDAIFGYNGLVMNNRQWADSILITGIDGFSDPDIRDDREVNPQDHGETAFESWYGGRTIVLKGYIRTFTLDKLRDMESAIKSAFMSLEEKPLVIQGRTLPTTVQIWCKKNAPMQWSEEQTRDDCFKRDFMITLRASNPRFFSVEEEVRREDFGVIDNFALDTIAGNNYKFIQGKPTVVVKGGSLTVTTTETKIFARQDPEFFQPQPSAQFDYTPKGSFVGSHIGFYLKYIDANNLIFLDITEAGAVGLSCRVAGVTTSRTLSYSLGSSPVSRVAGTTYRVKAELRGNFVWVYHGTTSEWKQISKYELTFAESNALGSEVYSRSYVVITPGSIEWTYDNVAFGMSVMTDEQVMTVVNNGIFEAQPIFELIGPMTSPEIHIAETDEALVFKENTMIQAGEIWMVDIREGTIIDSNGESRFGRLDPTSDWPELIEGENHLRFNGNSMSPSISGILGNVPGLVARYHHAWF